MAGGNRDKSNLIPVKKEDGKFDSRQRGMRDQQGRAGPTSSKGGVSNMHMNIKKEAAEEMDPTDIEHESGAEGEQQDQLGSSKKFTGRCRLFVGNLPGNIDENDFKEMFQKFGEVSEVFLNASRSFGFVKLDTRQNAETAKAALDGVTKAGRTLRVRFATHGAALKVKHLSPHVTNELLEEAFTIFGSVERAVVIVDDRGKPTGEGIVEFARKPGAQQALKRINDGVFLLATTPRPVAVEPLEQRDEEDGYPERFVPRNNEFNQEREQGPRFAQPGSFEYEFSLKWKELYMLEKQEQENVKRKMEEHEKRLMLDMEAAYHEYQTNMLRQDLLRRQEELKRLEEQHQQMLERTRHQQQDLSFNLGNRRRQQDEISMRRQEEDRRHQEMMRQQEDELRRRAMGGGSGPRQEDLFSQQERALREMRRGGGEPTPPMPPPPAPPAALGVERGGRQPMNMPGSGMNQSANNQMAMRQSRFDQPPPGMGFGNQSGGPGGMGAVGQMGGHPGMGGPPGGGPNNHPQGAHQGAHHAGRNSSGGRGERREEYFDAKRARRY